MRGGKAIPLKANADIAAGMCPVLEHILVVKRTGGEVNMVEGRDVYYDDASKYVSPKCEPIAYPCLLYTSRCV